MMMSARASTVVTGCLLVLVACGGSAPPVQDVTVVKAADPRAVEKYVAASRLLEDDAAKGGRTRSAEFEDKVIALLQEALALDPDLWEARHDLGVLYRRRGEMRRALQELQRAHETMPSADEPLLSLAEAEHALGDRERAVELLEAYVTRSPRSVPSRVALSALYREGGAIDRALAHARAALLVEPGQLDALLEVGRSYRGKGEHDVADLVFQKAAALDAKSPRPHNELGLTALARGDTQLAFKHFEAAIGIDASFLEARMNRAGVLVRVGAYERAASEYQRVLDRHEGSSAARVGLGIALRGQGKLEGALAQYEKVLSAEPNHADALFNAALLERDFLRKPEQARARFARFLEVAPDGPARALAERVLEESVAADDGGGP